MIDTDGDGYNDTAECKAGTDPNDPLDPSKRLQEQETMLMVYYTSTFLSAIGIVSFAGILMYYKRYDISKWRVKSVRRYEEREP